MARLLTVEQEDGAVRAGELECERRTNDSAADDERLAAFHGAILQETREKMSMQAAREF